MIKTIDDFAVEGLRSEPVRLVLLRHGQSEWNAAGIFTGWENAHLTAHGELEAARAGALLEKRL